MGGREGHFAGCGPCPLFLLDAFPRRFSIVRLLLFFFFCFFFPPLVFPFNLNGWLGRTVLETTCEMMCAVFFSFYFFFRSRVTCFRRRVVRRGSSEDSTGCCFVAPTGATQLSSVVSFVRFIFLMTTRAIFFTAYPDYIIIKMPLDSPFAVTVGLVAFSVPCVKKKRKCGDGIGGEGIVRLGMAVLTLFLRLFLGGFAVQLRRRTLARRDVSATSVLLAPPADRYRGPSK